MRPSCALLLIPALLGAVMAAAETLEGTVSNQTQGKPAAGVEVSLLSLSQGMAEVAHAKTDSAGHFKLDFNDPGAPHLVRVTHQEVNYFQMAPPGAGSVSLSIYDSAKKLDGIGTTVEVLRLQSDTSALQAIQVFAVQNHSQPPRALVGDHSYEIALPAGAVVDDTGARAPGGQPINTPAEPVSGKPGHYVFTFPLRPGETQFQVAYHLPYSGQKATLSLPILHDAQHVVAILPNSMQFSAEGAKFSPMADDKTANVQVSSNARAGTLITMSLSGTGVLPEANPQPQQDDSAGAQMGGQQPTRGPGGGLGAPINSPDPLSHYRLPLLGILAVLLIGGAVFVVRRRPVEVPEAMPQAPQEASRPVRSAPPAPGSSSILEGIKEELFQLELDRQQGRISAAEYADAKAALDLTLKRATSRGNRT